MTWGDSGESAHGPALTLTWKGLTLPMASRGRPKASYLWSLCSQVVRERDDYVCLRCARNFRHNSGVLDASHHISRRHGATKYDLQNVAALCRECHSWLDNHPLHHADFIRSLIGEQEWERLKAKSEELWKPSTSELQELSRFLRDTLKDLKRRRANGETGRLEI